MSVDKGVLKAVIDACVEGAKVLDLCQLGDQMILEETGKVFKKEKEMKKGQYTYEFLSWRHIIFYVLFRDSVSNVCLSQ